MVNLNLLFNKTYYKSISIHDTDQFRDSLRANNETLFNVVFCEGDYIESPIANKTILMKTMYPGVLVGTGYSHGASIRDADADIKCGFSFDYVTGQPYVPASSVKGLLRSAFAHHELIEQLCEKSIGRVPDLEKDIFGKPADSDVDGHGTDVFLDAVIRCGDNTGKILAPENITPHGKIYKEPKPINLIKIRPNVVLEFRFVLRDTQLENNGSVITITAEEKKELFKSLLELLGVGAKTNVGFGVLRNCAE